MENKIQILVEIRNLIYKAGHIDDCKAQDEAVL